MIVPYCKKCGRKLKEEAEECPECGSKKTIENEKQVKKSTGIIVPYCTNCGKKLREEAEECPECEI
ncbi:zinc-ribbon domain-containing protein [Methanonatronarchaeum sp. AMET-Sl]|uniref:zinc-ribbon domain-containing protein n=1 Tax=Methanonatronarchaeum sp. AMET-Sl TaxID=3037654 RepID=UPI00244E5173|nr:zinc-ribbon domain-containing protein [Methanonatronarchaeum sp. AMET-Sl]WGI17032.1 zinc-ribbon domain-containing protein [Methanonatronarchaeum sp. AMET-Sl]